MSSSDTVRITKKNIKRLGLSSLIISFVLAIILFSGYTLTMKMLKPVYATKSADYDVEKVTITEERTKPIYKNVEVEKVIEPMKMREIGSFNLTSYCPCTECCDQYGASPIGKTGAIGVGVYRGITFAVDPRVIPYGTKMYVEGVGVGIATDCGGAIKGNRIDVYIPDHQEARVFGRQNNKKVYIIEE